MCWLLPCPAASPRGTRDGEEDGVDGWGEMSWCGEEELPCLPPAPPHTAGCGVGSCITASPPAPGPGALECCHKCHTAVRSQPAPARRRLVPLLSPAWFSLVCFLCHTVQSLGFGGGLFFINPISLVIQITLPFLLKVAGVRAWRTQSPSLNSNQIRSTRVAKAQRGGEEVARKGLRA